MISLGNTLGFHSTDLQDPGLLRCYAVYRVI